MSTLDSPTCSRQSSDHVYLILSSILVALTLFCLVLNPPSIWFSSMICLSLETLGFRPIDYSRPDLDQMYLDAIPNTRCIQIDSPYQMSYWYTDVGSSTNVIYLPGLLVTRGYFFGPNLIKYISEVLECNVISFDYVGSVGRRYSDVNMLSDALVVSQHAISLLNLDNIILFGFSLGSNVAIGLNASLKMMNINPIGMIMVSPCIRFSMNSIMDELYSKMIGSNCLYVRSKKLLKMISCPVFITHSTNDLLVPAQDSIDLSQSLVEIDKTVYLYIVKRRGHNYVVADPQIISSMISYISIVSKSRKH